MAQTKKRRRRKHRGTQSGSIHRRGRTSRPRNRKEARSRARSQRLDRLDRPPTWRSAINRGLIAGAVFFVMILLLFKRPATEAIPLGIIMLGFYIPLGYFTDTFFYRRRQRQKQKQQQAEG